MFLCLADSFLQAYIELNVRKHKKINLFFNLTKPFFKEVTLEFELPVTQKEPEHLHVCEFYTVRVQNRLHEKIINVSVTLNIW